MTEIEQELKQAQADLKALQGELPQFHGLLTRNEEDVQRLRAERASLDEQAQARGRVNVARELLEQHQSDIQTAKLEVERLERIAAREHVLDEMAELAKEATRQRKEFEQALEAANTALLKHMEKLRVTLGGMNSARANFLAKGHEVSPAFGVTQYPTAWGAEKVKESEALGLQALKEIEARGADLRAVLSPYGREQTSPFDLDHPDKLVSPEPFAFQFHNSLMQAYLRHKFSLPKGK